LWGEIENCTLCSGAFAMIFAKERLVFTGTAILENYTLKCVDITALGLTSVQ